MMRKYNKKAFKLKYKITAPRIISKEAYKRILIMPEYPPCISCSD
jgi:hypothetical protein